MKRILAIAKYLTVIVAVAALGVLSAKQVSQHLNARRTRASALELKQSRREYTEGLLRSMNTIAVGDRLPDHQFQDLEGRLQTLSDLTGDSTLVILFHPSCHFCDDELDALGDAVSDPSHHQRFLLASPGDIVEIVEKKEQFGIQSLVLHDQDGEYLTELGVSSFPFNIVVRRDGVIQDIVAGGLDAEDLAHFVAFGSLE